MRGLVRLSALFLVLTTCLLWSDVPDPFDDPLHVQSAVAQPPAPGLAGPGGIIHYTASSSTAVNTINSTNLYDYTLSAAFVATSSFVSVTGTTTSINVVAASVPLHLHCNGKLSTNSSPGTTIAGVSFGPLGGTNAAVMASTSLMNGITLPASLAQTPLTVDVWIAPVATALAPTSTTTYLNARLAFQSGTTAALASETVFSGSQTAAVNLGQPNQLRVQWQWNTAASNNSIVLHNCALIQGN